MQFNNNNKKINSFVAINRLAYYFRKQSHSITKCQKCIALSTNGRVLKIDELILCLNCFGIGHTDMKLCLSKRVCSKCEKVHNMLFQRDVQQNVQNAPTSNVCNEVRLS